MNKQSISFKANEQKLTKTGGIEHYASNIVAYIEATFDLGTNWNGYDSVRAVWSNDYLTDISTVLDSNGKCIVPTEVLADTGNVTVNLVGSIADGDTLTDRLTTYPCKAVIVDADAKVEGEETENVTPSQFEQFVEIVHDEVEQVTGMTAEAETLPAGSDATASYSDGVLSFGIPRGDKGEQGEQGETGHTGAPAGFGNVTASVDNTVGTPSVVVNTSGPDTAKEFDFQFHNLKGGKGDTGVTGNGIASTVLNPDYTLTITFTDGTHYTTPSIRGAKGDTGATGNGIQSTVLNADYTLTITFTDGTSYTTPSIRGAKGDTGVGIESIYETGTSGAVHTYTILYTNGNTTTFNVTDGQVTNAALQAITGNLANLTTTDKANLVAAINELVGDTSDVKEDITYLSNEIGVPFLPMSGAVPAPAGAYVVTDVIKGINLKSGATYAIHLEVSAAVAYKIYGKLMTANDVSLKSINIEVGSTSVDTTYVADSNYNDAKIIFSAGVLGNVTISATIEDTNNDSYIDKMLNDISLLNALPNWHYSETPGYFNNDGSISTSNPNGERYTNKIDITGFTKIDYTQDVGNNTQFNAYVLYDQDDNIVGSRVAWYTTTKTILPSDTTGAKYIAFCYRTYNTYHPTIMIYKPVWGTESDTQNIANAIPDPFRFKPCYDHLFVIRGGNYVTIPHESIYHVRMSRLLGFNTIEANVAKTSDGVFIVNHLAGGGTFGNYFHHIDGQTDISNIAVSSVTWKWIEQNVRYNSNIPQYRTRPCTLQEFLCECRQQNIIPFVTSNDADAVAIVKDIMGDNNYIAYSGNRTNNPNAIIYAWVTKSTKQEIVDYCESVGKPFIYGMANPTDFSDSDLQDIIDTLHEKGYWIGTSYNDSNWYKYSYMGFDVNGTQNQVNRIDSGNVCNYNSLFGFNDFTFTNATESNGVLTYTASGTLSPNNLPNTSGIYMFDLEIEFDGSIQVPAVGEWISPVTFTSDGSYPVYVCVPIINSAPSLLLSVDSGTIIKDIKYKLSKL